MSKAKCAWPRGIINQNPVRTDISRDYLDCSFLIAETPFEGAVALDNDVTKHMRVVRVRPVEPPNHGFHLIAGNLIGASFGGHIDCQTFMKITPLRRRQSHIAKPSFFLGLSAVAVCDKFINYLRR